MASGGGRLGGWSVGLCEEDLGGGILAGVDAFARGVVLVEGDDADGGFGFVLDFGFVGFVGDEMAADEAGGLGEDHFEFVVGVGMSGVLSAEFEGFLEHGSVDFLEFGVEEGWGELVEGDGFLGAVKAAFHE